MDEVSYQKRVLQLCDEALAHDPDHRDGFLAEACDRNPELRASVETLMRAVDDADDFLSEESSYAPDSRIDRYRIVTKIGAGGMGTVYQAERQDESYTQRVALKVVRTHVQSNELIARFNEERRILATLNHPYIARLIDGGTTDRGLPYLVMELVEGVPIDEYCDLHQLSVNDRVRLVQKVAMAIQSAHQSLVVHRDLKPSNIMITEDGIPKLLDFGIAKLIKPGSGVTKGESSSFRSRALTPDYASPEQIAEGVVTTASDVYSLGVLTYKLLTGETPYEMSALTHREMSASMEKLTITLPSTRVSGAKTKSAMREIASCRSTSPARLVKQLAGDLDAVLTKALRKDPEQRYQSAAAFANDLERSGKGLPVAARGGSAGYRLRKFVGRNRLSVVASGTALLALMLGLGVSLWQAHIAKRRFDDLHGLAETVIYDLYDGIADLPGATPARELIAKEALHYLDRLARDAVGDRGLQQDLAMAYKRVGDVLGNPSNANLGDTAGALDSYRKALDIAEKLSSGIDDDPAIERSKAIIHEKMADVKAWRGDMDGALHNSEKSIAIFLAIAEHTPDNDKAILSVAISHVKRGDLLGNPNFPNAGETLVSTEQYRSALDVIGGIARQENSDWGVRRYLALIHERLGTMESVQGNTAAAQEHFEESLVLRERLAEEKPQLAESRRDVAVAFEKIADIQFDKSESAAALSNYRKALDIYQDLSKADPENINAARTLAIGLENVSEALFATGDREAALGNFQEVLDIRRSLVSRDPENERLASELQRVVSRVDAL